MRGLSRTTEKFRVGVTSKLRQSTKFVDGIYKMTLPPGSKVWRCSPKHPETKFNSLRWLHLANCETWGLTRLLNGILLLLYSGQSHAHAAPTGGFGISAEILERRLRSRWRFMYGVGF